MITIQLTEKEKNLIKNIMLGSLDALQYITNMDKGMVEYKKNLESIIIKLKK